MYPNFIPLKLGDISALSQLVFLVSPLQTIKAYTP